MDPEGRLLGRPWVKVCGVTDRAALIACAVNGVDAIGLVRAEASPRHLDDARIVELGRAARALGLAPILVAIELERDEAERLAAEAGLVGVQLAGESWPLEWRAFPGLVLRRVGVAEDPSERDARSDAHEIERWRGTADAFVLDRPEAAGGTGLPVDPRRATELTALAPCLLAGGLDGARVRDLPHELAERCRGFDASSRLEHGPGLKDPARIADFAGAVRALPHADPDRSIQ